MDDPLVTRAREFSMAAHAGQTRANGKPYHTHPFAVADLLADHGMNDAEILAAAYLHDVVEDTPTTTAELADRFGPRVARLVDEMTIPGAQAKSFEDKQKALLAAARSMSVDAKWIKMADRVHNLSEKLPQWSDDKRQRYVKASLALLDALRPWPSQSLAEQIVALAVPFAD